MGKTVSEAIEYRRSVRKYLDTDLNEEKVKNCIKNATLAPVSYTHLRAHETDS